MSNESVPRQTFENRIGLFDREELNFKQQARQVAWGRLIIFLSGVAGCWYFFSVNQHSMGIVTLLVAYILFLVALKKHTRLQYSQKHSGFLKNINEKEIARLNGALTHFDGGIRFQNPAHFYTSDLDIFGRHSLYQLLNRAVTRIGQNKLAHWLTQAAPAPEIYLRQKAIAEIVPDIDWRQQLQAKALHYNQSETEASEFFDWLKAPDFYQNKTWLKLLIFLLPVLTLTSLGFYFLDDVSGYPAAGFILIQYLLGYKYAAVRDEYYEKSSGMYDVLRSYRDLLQHIEAKTTQEEKWQKLCQGLVINGSKASSLIHQLAAIVEYLAARMNVFMNLILNSVLMWDFFWMWRLENWKKQMAANLKNVLDIISETEALSSLAAFQYANPAYTVPNLTSAAFTLAASDMGHPLIFAATPITNNFKTTGKGKTCILTGSNMSGKSTFLRTVGINLVLAQCGAVVSASNLTFWPTQVYTAMRTEDNLAESTSSFYAELKRLRLLLDFSGENKPVFYLLDEILKGTNSGDRHAGAKALIKQLHLRNATGLVSTHDLELGALENEHPDYITNYSFNSTIEGDKITFDYKLQPGMCKSFNASKLMQLMGIDMNLI